MNNDKVVNDYLQRCQYKYKDLTRRDIMSTLSYFKELAPRVDKYVAANGTSRELISLLGTIPVNYRNSVYNIPLQLYLPDGYPYEPPMVYVRPTVDMSINVNSTVDQSGRVYLPELNTEWRHPKSDLEQTPLYTKTKSTSTSGTSSSSTANYGYSSSNTAPYPTQPTPYPLSNTGMPMPMPGSTSSSSPPIAANPYYPMNSQPSQQPLSHLRSNSNSNIGQTRPSYVDDTIKPEHYRISVITAVHDRIRAKYKELNDEKTAEVDSLKRVRNDLHASRDHVNALLNEAEQETVELRDLTGKLRARTTALTESINRIKYRDKANIEDAVITTTPLYRQIFMLFAEDLAIQDLIFYLGEGLAHKSLSLDSFLKQIRALTRKQFLLRATIQKARQKAALSV